MTPTDRLIFELLDAVPYQTFFDVIARVKANPKLDTEDLLQTGLAMRDLAKAIAADLHRGLGA
jgi:hypothetical protein